MDRKPITLAMVAFLAVILAAPTLFSSDKVEAAQIKRIEGTGIGDIICPPTGGGIAPGQNIQFSAYKDRGILSGFFSTSPSTAVGTINSGSFGANSFRLSGIENFDSACASLTPTTFTITGHCSRQGEAVTAQFVAATGEKITFMGNVACSIRGL